MNGLDLFSGIGGITLGLSKWVKPVAYCEIEEYAQAVLISKMENGLLPKAPIWDDIKTLKGCNLPNVDIVYGGFPCQDISCAGNGKGLDGKRSGLFFEVCRLVEEINPRFVFLENVPAIRTRGLREVIRAFTDMGYDCRWTCVSAAEVGALHLRKRWFLLCRYAEKWERTKKPNLCEGETSNAGRICEDVSHARGEYDKPKPGSLQESQRKARQQKWGQGSNDCNTRQPKGESINIRTGWAVEPNVGRVVNGLPFRMDRVKSLGNAVVPSQVSEAFKRLLN